MDEITAHARSVRTWFGSEVAFLDISWVDGITRDVATIKIPTARHLVSHRRAMELAEEIARRINKEPEDE